MPKLIRRKNDSRFDHIKVDKGMYKYVGRRKEIASIIDKFVKDEIQVVFLHGAPQTGKDTFAIQVGHQLVKIYEADEDGNNLHAYSINFDKKLENPVEVTEEIERELWKVHSTQRQDLNTFLGKSDEFHLFILNGCDRYADNPELQTIFLDSITKLVENNNLFFIITSRKKYKVLNQLAYSHTLQPLKKEDAKELLQIAATDEVEMGNDVMDKIIHHLFPLPISVIMVGKALKDGEYEPNEMVDVLKRSALSICSDESYSNSERLGSVHRSALAGLSGVLTEAFGLISYLEDERITADNLAEILGECSSFVKQDILNKLVRQGVMDRQKTSVHVPAQGSADVTRSLICEQQFMDPVLKRNPLVCKMLARFKIIAESSVEEIEYELDKQSERVQTMRNLLLSATRENMHERRRNLYKEALDIGCSILQRFVRPLSRCNDFVTQCSELIEQNVNSTCSQELLSSESVQSITPNREPVESDDRCEVSITSNTSKKVDEQNTPALYPHADEGQMPDVESLVKGLQVGDQSVHSSNRLATAQKPDSFQSVQHFNETSTKSNQISTKSNLDSSGNQSYPNIPAKAVSPTCQETMNPKKSHPQDHHLLGNQPYNQFDLAWPDSYDINTHDNMSSFKLEPKGKQDSSSGLNTLRSVVPQQTLQNYPAETTLGKSTPRQEERIIVGCDHYLYRRHVNMTSEVNPLHSTTQVIGHPVSQQENMYPHPGNYCQPHLSPDRLPSNVQYGYQNPYPRMHHEHQDLPFNPHCQQHSMGTGYGTCEEYGGHMQSEQTRLRSRGPHQTNQSTDRSQGPQSGGDGFAKQLF
ncbi:uncharacterized protein LOC144441130 [Glandiceps talaboti]